MSDKIESGVARFDGAMTTKWYAWARRVMDGRSYRKEGPLRVFKWRAKLDVFGLKRKLR